MYAYVSRQPDELKVDLTSLGLDPPPETKAWMPPIPQVGNGVNTKWIEQTLIPCQNLRLG